LIFLQVELLKDLPLPQALLERAAQETLEFAQSGKQGDLSIVLTGDEALQRLNHEFMGIDAPTDVLSFPADFIDPDTSQPYLGDVIISIPRAKAQAFENGQSVQDEVLLLVVHGVLHLLGYDHALPEEKEQMWAAQAAVLSRLPRS